MKPIVSILEEGFKKIQKGSAWAAGFIIAATIVGSGVFTTLGLVYNFINSKVLLIQVGCLMIIIVGLLVISWRTLLDAVRHSLIVRVVGIFIGISVVATFCGVDPWFSLFGHFERVTGLLFTLVTAFGALSTFLILRESGEVRRFVLWPIAVLGGTLGVLTWLGVSGLAISQSIYLGQASGGGATMGNSSFAGTVLIIGFFMALYLLVTASQKTTRITAGILAFFSLVNPVLVSLPFFKPLAGTVFGFIGDARGATMSLIIGLVVAGLVYALYDHRLLVRRGALAFLGGVGVSLAAGVVLLVLPHNPIHNYFIATSGEARFIYWGMSIKQIAHHPLLGTGPETFRYAHQQFYTPRLALLGEPWADKPHNVYLEVALGTGILGLVAYLAIFASIKYRFMVLIRQRRDRAFVALAGGLLTAFTINNIILFDTMTSTLLFMLIVMWVAYHAEFGSALEEHEVSRDHSTPRDRSATSSGARSRYQLPEVLLRCFAAGLVIVGGYLWVHGEVVKLGVAWDELFSKPPVRTVLYLKGEQASHYGAGISFAQRADDYGQTYLSKQASIRDDRERTIIVKDIEAIVVTLDRSLSLYPPNIQTYQALGNLSIAYLEILGKAATPEITKQWLTRIVQARDGIRSIAPTHPRAEVFDKKINQLTQVLLL